MPSVNQCDEADRLRSTVINKCIKPCANRAARIEHVINQDHGLVRDVARDARATVNRRNGDCGEIVTIETDV